MNGTLDVAFSLTQQDRHTEMVPLVPVEHRKHKTGNSMAGLRYPSHGRSRQSGYPIRPSAEGRSSWLNFLRKILSFSIPNRFILARCVAFFLFLFSLLSLATFIRSLSAFSTPLTARRGAESYNEITT